MNRAVITHTTVSNPVNQKLPVAATLCTRQGHFSLALVKITPKPAEPWWGEDSALWQAGFFLALSAFQIFLSVKKPLVGRCRHVGFFSNKVEVAFFPPSVPEESYYCAQIFSFHLVASQELLNRPVSTFLWQWLHSQVFCCKQKSQFIKI